MSTRVVVLGAGFGGLELSSRLAAALGDDVEIILIDRADHFVFGFSKLDLLFGGGDVADVALRYSDITIPQVRFRQETITAIDPADRRVTTDLEAYEADVLVVALGADYDVEATPGLAAAGNEFYSVDGALRAREALKDFTGGHVVVGVCGPSFKCPPAPSETALLLDDNLRARGIRDRSSIQLVMPFGIPVPPSPETSEALLSTFAERGIEYVADNTVTSLDPSTHEAVLRDGRRLPYDLFLGIPVHRAPQVILDSELPEDGWIPVDRSTLATRFEHVYAVGDVTSVGTAKAGVFSEGQAGVVADHLIARLRGEAMPQGYDGKAACYIEFGGGDVARVDVDFFSDPRRPIGVFSPPSDATKREKAAFADERRQRWLGR